MWLLYSTVAGGKTTVSTQALQHSEAFANRRTLSAASTTSAAVTAVPEAGPHAAAGTLSNPSSAIDHDVRANIQQQQTPAQQADENADAYATSAGSSPQLLTRSHRHQGPILWRPSLADRLSRSISARNSHAGSTTATGAGSPAQAPGPLQPAVTQGLRSTAAPPRSPLPGLPPPPPPPAPPRAAHAPNLHAASSAVRQRTASYVTSPDSSETRAAANSPRAFANHSVVTARSPATSAYLPGFSAGFLASAPHRPRPDIRRAASRTLRHRPTSRPALSPDQTGVPQETGTLLSLSLQSDMWVLSVCLLVTFTFTDVQQ